MDNSQEIKCPLCGIGTLRDEICDHETYVKEGDHKTRITIKGLPVKRCSNCKEEILPKDSLDRVQAEKHKKRGLLTMDELKAIRGKLGLTLEDMADLLGLGKKTYLRWEKGSYIQNKAMDRYVRLIDANPENIAILKRISGQEKPGQ